MMKVKVIDEILSNIVLVINLMIFADGKMIPVLKMSSFRTTNNHAFYAIARSFNHLLQEHNLTHVILDVTQNG